MALPVQSYVWPRLKSVVGQWVSLVTGVTEDQLLWSDANETRPAGAYVGLTRRTFEAVAFDTEQTTEVALSATATVTASAVGETASMLLGKLPLAYTLGLGQSTEFARDQLILQAAASFEPVVATASGLDAIDFTPKNGQAVWVTPVENVTVVETRDFRLTSIGMRRAIVRVSLIDFSTDGADLDESADEYADELIASLLTPGKPGSVFLRENSVGVENQATISTQNVSVNKQGAGGIREERVIFDVQFNVAARRLYPENSIDSVEDPIVEVAA